MTVIDVIASKPVNLGKQPDGKLVYWTPSDVDNGVVKTVEATPIIERYIDLGFLKIVQKKKVKKKGKK